MKDFLKHNENFVCEECGRTFLNVRALALHLHYSHDGNEEYFEKWLRNDTDNCIICGEKTKFKNFYDGCVRTCSKKCKALLIKRTKAILYGDENFNNKNKREQTCIARFGSKTFTGTHAYKEKLMLHFGVENQFQRKEVKEIAKITCLKNNGVENISQSPTAKLKKEKTCIKNHGVKAGFNLIEKSKASNLKNLGVEYPMQSDAIKEKSKRTCMLKYGVEFVHQNKEIHEKSQKTAKTLKLYEDDIWYRGSYELDFLNKFYDLYDIQNAPSIKYVYKNKNKVYHPDFYIPSLNLIVEIKNSYLAKRDAKQIHAKETATLSAGFNYILLVDKDYTELLALKTI